MQTLWRDLRYGARLLLKAPGFTLTAVFILALGIGANTAIFSIVDAILLTPLPYKNADRLVMLWETNPKQRIGLDNLPVAAGNFLEWQDQNDMFEAMSAMGMERMTLTGYDKAQNLIAATVSASFFDVIGVQPQLGRPFSRLEDQPQANHVTVISDGLWRRAFAAKADIVGKTITLNGKGYIVIGIMPAGFLLRARRRLPS